MARRMKALVPIVTNLLYPEVPEGVADKIHLKRQKAKSYHDRNVKVLPDLDIGPEVCIAPVHRGKSWEAGNLPTEALRQILPGRTGLKITAGDRTMSGQDDYLS